MAGASYMGDLFQLLIDLDREAIRATGALRWEPATAVLALISAWWVKGPLVVAVAWYADLRGRRIVPLIAIAATVSFFVASALNFVLKDLVGRDRPPAAIGLDALVGVPGSPSFPSGHAMTAFATAAASARIGFSRVYLGVHFWIDVLVGSLFGLAIGAALAWPLRSRCRRPPAPSPAPSPAPA